MVQESWHLVRSCKRPSICGRNAEEAMPSWEVPAAGFSAIQTSAAIGRQNAKRGQEQRLQVSAGREKKTRWHGGAKLDQTKLAHLARGGRGASPCGALGTAG